MRRATNLVVSAAVLPGLLALAACSGSSGTPKAAASGTSAPAPAATSAAAGGASAAASPTTVVSPYGNVGLSSAALNAAMATATGSATALHIDASLESNGAPLNIDAQLNKDGTGAGDISAQAFSIPFIAIGGVTYVQCTPGFISLTGMSPDTPANKAIVNKWVPSTNSAISATVNNYSTFMTMSAFLTQTVESGDNFVTEGTATVNGQTVANYRDTTTGDGDLVLSVPATGPALPVQDVETGSTPGSMKFTWNQPTKVSGPPAAQVYAGS